MEAVSVLCLLAEDGLEATSIHPFIHPSVCLSNCMHLDGNLGLRAEEGLEAAEVALGAVRHENIAAATDKSKVRRSQPRLGDVERSKGGVGDSLGPYQWCVVLTRRRC